MLFRRFSLPTSLVFTYLCSIPLFYLALHLRARWNHQTLWRPREWRTYKVSDEIQVRANAWFQDAVAMRSVGNATARVSQHPPLLCIRVDTFERDGVDYLPAAMGSLLGPLSLEDRWQLYIIARSKNGGGNGVPSTSFQAMKGVGLVEELQVRPGDEDALWSERYLRAANTGRRVDAEGVLDWAHLLELCLNNSDAPYILIIEDDVVSHPEWFTKVKKWIIPSLEEKTRGGSKWIYTYLFTASNYQGWESKDTKGIVIGLVGLYVGLLALGVCLFGRTRGKDPSYISLPLDIHDSPPSHRRIMVLLCPLLMAPHTLLFFLQGRHAAFLIPIGLSPAAPNACCAQALLFSRESARFTAGHLLNDGYADQRQPMPRDLAASLIAERNAWVEYVWKDSLWQHVGVWSSKQFGDPHRVKDWSFEMGLIE